MGFLQNLGAADASRRPPFAKSAEARPSFGRLDSSHWNEIRIRGN